MQRRRICLIRGFADDAKRTQQWDKGTGPMLPDANEYRRLGQFRTGALDRHRSGRSLLAESVGIGRLLDSGGKRG
jgi:hypothetical protein